MFSFFHKHYRLSRDLQKLKPMLADTASIIARNAKIHGGAPVLIDCGMNAGVIADGLLRRLPNDFFCYGFEVNAALFQERLAELQKTYGPRLSIEFSAVSTHDDGTTFRQMGKSDKLIGAASTTIIPQIRDRDVVGVTQAVTSIDFSRRLEDIWRRHSNGVSPYVAVKMDIEGAEYDVLEKLIADGAAGRIDDLFVEFHARRFDANDRPDILNREKEILLKLATMPIRTHAWL